MTGKNYSIIWVMIEKFGGTFVSVASFFVFAFLLSPSDIGTAAIVLAISLGVAQVASTLYQDPLVCTSKLSIRKLSSAVWGSIFISGFLYFLIYVCAHFYIDSLEFKNLLLLSAILVPVLSICSIYTAILRRKDKFKLLSKILLISKFIGATVGIICAFYGLGAIAMIFQAIVAEIIALILFIWFQKLRLAFHFSFNELKQIVSLGFFLLIRKLSWESCIKGLPLLVGTIAGATAAGLFTFAWRIVNMPATSINAGLLSYVLPRFAKVKHDRKLISTEFEQVTGFTMLLCCPLFLGLAAVTAPLIEVLFGGKWADAVLSIQLLCFYVVIGISRIYVPSVFTAIGKPSVSLGVDVLATISCLLLCYFLIDMYGHVAGVIAILLRVVFTYPVSLYVMKSHFNIGYFVQMKGFLFYFICSFIMFNFVLILQKCIDIKPALELASSIFLGALFYIVIILIFDKRIKGLINNKISCKSETVG